MDITGGIRDTVELVLDQVVPWRKENKKKLAELAAKQKELELAQKEAEVVQARINVINEAKQAGDRGRLVQVQVKEQELKNQKVQLENQQMQLEMMQLALDMVERVNPEMEDRQKMLYAMKMIDPIRLVALSPLEIMEIDISEAARTEAEADGDLGEAAEVGDE